MELESKLIQQAKDLKNTPVAQRIKNQALSRWEQVSFMPRKSRKARSAGAQRADKGKLTKLLAVTLSASLAIVWLKTVTHSSFIKLPTLKEQKAGVEVYDIDDKLVTVVQKDGEREPIGLDKISPFMRQAVIGIEDHNFYHHPGIDPLGITRAMYKNAMARQWIEGGSTITQQLMKTMYFGHDDRTARRKILEIFMALDIETCYSKDKILETYLNEVYYGRGAYGIERASQTYFNKPASKLTLSESAFLAALIKAPSDLGQEAHFKRAQKRQKEVLDGMTECGFITKDQASKAKTAKLAFKPGPHALRHPYNIHVFALENKRSVRTNSSRVPSRSILAGTEIVRMGKFCDSTTPA
ncbi:MAG: transglycosylase domain-containing protein [Candidatus Obscuribacterales bacterium]|nr:transglycosylase domain-containing protein [Candidatus Obscuribacterales bacterium]